MSGRERSVGTWCSQAGGHAIGIDNIYRRHAEWLRGALARRLRLQAADVDDIVQDTFLHATRHGEREIAHPKAFLSQIALNLFRDRKRRETVRAEHRRVALLVVEAEGAGPPGLSEQEARVQIAQLVDTMPEAYRDVFVLSRFRHMTNQEIATHLGLAVKTIEWRMGKALEFCVDWLGS